MFCKTIQWNRFLFYLKHAKYANMQFKLLNKILKNFKIKYQCSKH